ncbi:MAG: hypothetical protein KAQ83_03025 [Nanoarchaeota archaeon]|nr:hypothetical protein [Nanoarchaeota archaeon]
MNKFLKVLLKALPLAGPMIVFIFTKNEYLIALSIILFITIILKVKYYKNEWIILLVGIVCGIIGEVGGDLIYKMQSWESGSFFGVPIWLPLFWGYIFLLTRRVGNLIVKNKEN